VGEEHENIFFLYFKVRVREEEDKHVKKQKNKQQGSAKEI